MMAIHSRTDGFLVARIVHRHISGVLTLSETFRLAELTVALLDILKTHGRLSVSIDVSTFGASGG